MNTQDQFIVLILLIHIIGASANYFGGLKNIERHKNKVKLLVNILTFITALMYFFSFILVAMVMYREWNWNWLQIAPVLLFYIAYGERAVYKSKS